MQCKFPNIRFEIEPFEIETFEIETFEIETLEIETFEIETFDIEKFEIEMFEIEITLPMTNLLFQLFVGHRQQWISYKMNIRHPGLLKN